MKIKPYSSKRRRKFAIFRWIVFAIIISMGFVFSTTGTGIKPLVLIPMALCISYDENEFTAAIIGLFCGLLTDISCGKLCGYNAILFLCICVFSSMLFAYLLRHNFINLVIISTAFIFLQGALDYLFYYYIWSYDNVSIIYTDYILPSCIFTTISFFVIYPLVRLVKKLLTPRRESLLKENEALIKD